MIALLGLVLALVSAPTDAKSGLVRTAKADSGRAVATKAKVDAPDTSSRKAVATKAKVDAPDTSSRKAVATKAKADAPDTSSARAVATKATAIDTGAMVATRAVRDTAEVHHLPPRTLPLKRQMMFAGGFMVFIALMMTSLQNFNPND
ncbi:MAG: hypothetical protein IPK50_13250 [Fibrobacterota bacterium]|nr:hypothetical protein [Fibrobacterota bacterium]QQS03274.1 MAG: hypothetical protein IPK50_13250 [Fibrobacterota bacterium]